MEVHSWLHAPEGVAQNMLGVLGFATDEINQTQQALWNALSQDGMRVLSPDVLDEATPVVLVASGPSLNSHIEWLKDNQNNFNIVAAGSALGVLLRAGIRPSVAVFLERGSEVFFDLCSLLVDGFSLEQITVFVSSTIDPRVPELFERSVFFHRPVASATELFPSDQAATMAVCGPHVVNAALEALLCLGSREFLLVGTDFGTANRDKPRADDALGNSPRTFTIPVKGNLGRTIFSEPELIQSATILNRLLSSANCNAVRIGEGIVLDSVSSCEPTDKLALQFSRSPQALNSAIARLPLTSFSRDDCKDFLDLVNIDMSLMLDGLHASVDSTDNWNRSLVDSISPLMQRLHVGDTRQRRFLSRLYCNPIFYSAMNLHDASAANDQSFQIARNNFLTSISILRLCFSQWILSLKPFIAARQLPMWDPGWISMHFGEWSTKSSESKQL